MGIRKALIVLLVAALLSGYAGCGGSGTMTVAEYKESMSDMQDRVSSALETALEKLETVNEDDIFDLYELQGVLEEQRSIIDSVAREAIGMNTPPEVEDLHKELLRYYVRAERATGQIANGAGFFQAILSMLVDVRNLALPNIPEDSQAARINAACEEDAATMHLYLKHLKGITPPEQLQFYRDKLNDLFNSVEEAVAGVDRATSPDDTSAFIQFQQDFPAVLHEVNVLQGEITVYIYLYSLRIKNLIRDGAELTQQIDEL
jgi:phage gp36-like protein